MSTRLTSVIVVLGTFMSLVISAGASAATISDAAMAKALNMTPGELPSVIKWTSAAATLDTPAQAALGVKAVDCVRASGRAGAKVSTDPYGTTEIVGGTVTADVQSPTFSMRGSSSGLPSVSSEVVMLKTASAAENDLSALSSTPARGCLTNLLVAFLKSAGAGRAKVVPSSQALPHFGTGSGGFGFRYVVSGSGISGSLIDYTYFYVQGRAEIDLEFTNANTQFSTTWANAIAERVMDRAKSLLG